MTIAYVFQITRRMFIQIKLIKDIESGKREMGGISEVANMAGNYCSKQLGK